MVWVSRDTWWRISPTTSACRGFPLRSSASSSSAPESPASGFLISWARPVAISPTVGEAVGPDHALPVEGLELGLAAPQGGQRGVEAAGRRRPARRGAPRRRGP